MDRVSTHIFLGSSRDALHSPGLLNTNEITAVLNVANDLTNPNLTHRQFRMAHVGLGDGAGNPKELLYASVLTLAGLLKEGHTVLTHCHEGRSRSPSVVATYLVTVEAFPSIEEALGFLKKCRPFVAPEAGIIQDFESLSQEVLRDLV